MADSESRNVPLNIALVPTRDVCDKLIALSTKVANLYSAHFSLDGVGYHPHSTNYKITTLPENMPVVVDVVKEVLDDFFLEPIPVLEVSAGRGYVFLRLELTENLRELHRELVLELDRYRFPTSSGRWSGRELTAAERHNLRRYGHPNVLDTFAPHSTLIRLKSQADAELAAALLEDQPDLILKMFIPHGVGIFRSGDHGTARELICEVPLT